MLHLEASGPVLILNCICVLILLYISVLIILYIYVLIPHTSMSRLTNKMVQDSLELVVHTHTHTHTHTYIYSSVLNYAICVLSLVLAYMRVLFSHYSICIDERGCARLAAASTSSVLHLVLVCCT